MRRMDDGRWEMKRLYVRPAHRGSGLGRRLILAIIEQAREIGYVKMRLDTMPKMNSAQVLYESFGFRDILAYRYNPEPGARFLELSLYCFDQMFSNRAVTPGAGSPQAFCPENPGAGKHPAPAPIRRLQPAAWDPSPSPKLIRHSRSFWPSPGQENQSEYPRRKLFRTGPPRCSKTEACN